MHAQSAATWFACPRIAGMRPGPEMRLGVAFVASVIFHACFLNWQVHVPTLGQLGLERPAIATLRVSLRIQQDQPAAVPEDTSVKTLEPSTPPVDPSKAVDVLHEKPQSSALDAKASQESIPLAGYYPVSKLTLMPDAISRFDIKAPVGGDTGLGGKITIRVWINAKGGLDNVRVVANGLPADYAEVALAAFGKLRFSPGQINGVPVPAWADIVIEYADFTRDPGP